MNQLLNQFHASGTFLHVAVDATTWFAGGISILMALHISADLLARSVFNHPLLGTGETVTNYYMVILSFLPLGLITREREHITVGLFTDRLPKRLLTSIDTIADLITLGFVVIVVWMAAEIAIQKTVLGETRESATGYLPIWQARWVVVLGFGLMCLYSIINTYKDFALLGKRVNENII